ncbi:hypothetical protein TWF102_005379 [Orbilia oligospora]|uniref:WSC domain-containing protein n=1 Tax=Orbilia oligospora TaxID=2813651 RepID=A0A7C8NCU3_ORBOL|nr:hypothetical protein TWF102_005379 [Orbilia oligospora]KAF3114159.1 hypothetical protein TWF103_001579 [Orbilia oligospora]KAF3136607.1 hypothetical protein TWF594_007865 [Orbilia oligospora]
MFLKALLAPAALIGLASAVALPPSNGLDLSTHSLNKRTATMWTWFPPIVHATPWKYVGCFSGDAPLTYHVADFCSCHNKPTDAVKHMSMEKCFASCKAAGFRYAGLKGPNGAKKCWCGSADPAEYKLPSTGTCNVACGDGEGNLASKYSTNQCGGQTSYSIWRDPCYKRKFDIDNAPLGYESAGCWSGNGGWLLAHFEKSVSGDNLSIDSCIEACSANGYPYAGMRGGWECFCGGRLSPYFVDVHQKNPNHNTMCTKVCTSTWKVYATTPKEEWQYCGGDVYYSLYFNRNLAAAEVCNADDDDDDEGGTKTVSKIVQTVTVTKGGPPPKEATQSFNSDKTTRTTITITGKAEPTPDPEDDDKDNKEDDDTEGGDDDDEPTQTTTITLTRTSGGPAPKTDPPGKGTVYVTTTVPARAKTTITLTQTSGEAAPTGKNNKNTVYTTVTVPAKRTKTTITLTQTSGEAAPTGKNNKNTVYTTVTVPAKRTKTTITLTQTSGEAAPTGKNNKNTVYTTVTVPASRRGNGGKTTTITLTRTSGGPAPTTARPGKGTVYVTTTVPATKPSDKPEEPEDDDDDKKDDGDDKKDDENPDDDNGNPGGKGGDDDDKKDDDGKKDDDDNGNPGGKGGDDDDKKDDGENPDDNNGNPGGKGGEEPGDKGPDLDDSLCSKPTIPAEVVKNTKWKNIKFPVGDVKAPAVSCHNRKSKYDAGYHFKLFVGPGTAWPDAVCRKDYTRKTTEIQAACSNACIEQKKSCTSSSKVRKIADYKALCEAQLIACQAINSLKVLPKYIELIKEDYCKKPSPPFPKPPKAGGKPADDDEEEEIQYS